MSLTPEDMERRLEEILRKSVVEAIVFKPFSCLCRVEGAYCRLHGEFNPVMPTAVPMPFPTTRGGRRIVRKKISE